jgi:hypothetical protein
VTLAHRSFNDDAVYIHDCEHSWLREIGMLLFSACSHLAEVTAATWLWEIGKHFKFMVTMESKSASFKLRQRWWSTAS